MLDGKLSENYELAWNLQKMNMYIEFYKCLGGKHGREKLKTKNVSMD